MPGEITSALSAGTNDLLRLGATPVTCAADVLELFDLVPRTSPEKALSPDATRVLERLQSAAASADELARATGLDVSAVTGVLVELELAGAAVEGEGRYRAAG